MSSALSYQIVQKYISAYKAGVLSHEEAAKRLGYGNHPVILSKGETYHAIPQGMEPIPIKVECEYCGCDVVPEPTCSQCNAPISRHTGNKGYNIGIDWSI